jgi:hypothetical protein
VGGNLGHKYEEANSSEGLEGMRLFRVSADMLGVNDNQANASRGAVNNQQRRSTQ